jgi:hypothetical protein
VPGYLKNYSYFPIKRSEANHQEILGFYFTENKFIVRVVKLKLSEDDKIEHEGSKRENGSSFSEAITKWLCLSHFVPDIYFLLLAS